MLRTGRRGFEATRSPATAGLSLFALSQTVNGTVGGWRLASGHYIAAKMTPQIIHPRPDSAPTNAWARCRRAPSGVPWSIPVCVQGGAWPFLYEIVSNGGATGLTITETLPGNWLTGGLQGYGVLSWASPVVGTYTIVVRVTDQDLTPIERTFTLTVIDRDNTTYFMWLDAVNGSNSNAGTFTSPKQTIAAMYGVNKNDISNDGKQIHYRAGTYNVTDAPVLGGTGQQLGMTRLKPQVHVGYEGETVIFDNQNTAYWNYETGSGDLWFSNITWRNPTVQENSVNRKTHIRLGTASHTRACFFRMTWQANTDVSGSGSNPACVMFGGNPEPGSYFSIIQNTYDAIDNMDFALFYDTSDVLVEGARVINGAGSPTTNGGGAGGFFFKGNTIRRVTVRACVGISAGIEIPLLYFSQFTPLVTDVRENFEVCWNLYKNEATQIALEGAGGVSIGQGDGSIGNHYGNFWSYRNNWHNPHIGLIGIGAGGPFQFQNDVIHHSGTYTDGFYIFSSAGLSVPGMFLKTNLATGTNYLDSTTVLLTGSARTTYLGTHGCEVV